LASSTTFVLGDVSDGEDQFFVVAVHCAVEAIDSRRTLGKAAARLDSEKVFVVVAESVLGSKRTSTRSLTLLPSRAAIGRRKYVP